MAFCDDLPLEIMSKILALVTAKKVRTDWSRKYWTEEPDANTTYLQRMTGYTLVCKKWNSLLWQNHPDTIRVKPSSQLVNLLHKIPFLSKLELEVGFSAVQRDVNIFIDSLCASKTSWTSFADVLPYLKEFVLESTFKNDNIRALHRHITKFMESGITHDADGLSYILSQIDALDDSCMSEVPSSKEKYSLQRFVRFPEDMKLRCRTVPYEMLNVASMVLDSPSYVTDKDLRFLKQATCLQSFQCGSLACEACDVGNKLTDKILQYLPPILLELKLGPSPEFVLPTRCRWPPGLQKLFLRSIQFRAPSAGLLPDSLQHFGIDFEKGESDLVGYPFSNFDMSSLPRGLKCLEFLGIKQYNRDTIKITGAAPLSVHTVLTNNMAAVNRHSFPLSCKFGDESDAWEFWY
jgi:hypothetical protein